MAFYSPGPLHLYSRYAPHVFSFSSLFHVVFIRLIFFLLLIDFYYYLIYMMAFKKDQLNHLTDSLSAILGDPPHCCWGPDRDTRCPAHFGLYRRRAFLLGISNVDLVQLGYIHSANPRCTCATVIHTVRAEPRAFVTCPIVALLRAPIWLQLKSSRPLKYNGNIAFK